MITILLTEDEERICQLFADVLSRYGYIIMNAPGTGGTARIVRRAGLAKEEALVGGLLDLTQVLVKYKSGEIYKSLLTNIEKPLIETVLKRTDGNKIKVAKILGINRNTLDAKIKKLEIDVQKWKIY